MQLEELIVKISGETSGLESALGKATGLVTNVGKVAGAVFGAAMAGVSALTTSAINGYAEYELLVGGVETLFGLSADKVKLYADLAYKTAQIDANNYLDTITSFSASLLLGLGGDTAQAAEIADMAIIDMADNANKMGTNMESILNAYQGFAKLNFTMLDNLKLGYGGTQLEMVRLINDSGVLNETISSMDGISFDTIIKAIHQILDNLKITGTSAKEANTTISGSMNTLKSSWTNFVKGLPDDLADISRLIEELADSAVTVTLNLIPRIEQALKGISGAIKKLSPVIAKELPKIITATLPDMIDAAGELVAGIGEALPDIFSSLTEIVGDILGDVFGEEVGNNAKKALSAIGDAIGSIVDIISSVAPLVETTVGTILDLVATILPALEPAFDIIGNLVDVVLPVITPMIEAIGAVLSPVFEVIGYILEAVNMLTSGPLEWLADLMGEVKTETEQSIGWLLQYNDLFGLMYDVAKLSAKDIAEGFAGYEEAYKLLQQITDEEGRVKEGYSNSNGEIDTAIEKLNELKGVHLEYKDGTIVGLEELNDLIKDSIYLEEARLMLEAYGPARIQALQDEAKLRGEVTDAMEKANEWQDIYNQAIANGASEEAAATKASHKLKASKEELVENLDLATEAYAKNLQVLSDTSALDAAIKSGEGLEEVTKRVGNGMITAGAATTEALLQLYQDADSYWRDLQTRYENGEAGITENQVKQARERRDLAFLEYLEELHSAGTFWDDLAEAAKIGLTQQRSMIQQGWEDYVKPALSEYFNNWRIMLVGSQEERAELAMKNAEKQKQIAQDEGEGVVTAMANGLVSGKQTLYWRAEELGALTIQGFADGNSNNSWVIFDAVSNWASTALSKIKSIFGIHSPSTETDWIAKMLVEGMSGGFDRYGDLAVNSAENLADDILNAFSADTALVDDLTSSFDDMLINSSVSDELMLSEGDWIDLFITRFNELQDDRNIILLVDGKTFALTSIKSINQLTKQTGKLALNLA